jgi:hypothetical protein
MNPASRVLMLLLCVVSGQKFCGEKGSVRWCVVMLQQPVLLSLKLGAKSLQIFTQSP